MDNELALIVVGGVVMLCFACILAVGMAMKASRILSEENDHLIQSLMEERERANKAKQRLRQVENSDRAARLHAKEQLAVNEEKLGLAVAEVIQLKRDLKGRDSQTKTLHLITYLLTGEILGPWEPEQMEQVSKLIYEELKDG